MELQNALLPPATVFVLYRFSSRGVKLDNPAAVYITAMLVPAGGEFEVNRSALAQLGVHTVLDVASRRDAQGCTIFDTPSLVKRLSELLLQPEKTPLLQHA